MATACGTEEFESQQRTYGMTGWDHGRAGETGLAKKAVERDLNEEGKEKKQAAELGAERTGLQVEFTDVSNVSGGWS